MTQIHSFNARLHIPQSSKTGASSWHGLVSYLGHSLEESYPSAEMQSLYFTAQTDWAGMPDEPRIKTVYLCHSLPCRLVLLNTPTSPMQKGKIPLQTNFSCDRHFTSASNNVNFFLSLPFYNSKLRFVFVQFNDLILQSYVILKI